MQNFNFEHRTDIVKMKKQTATTTKYLMPTINILVCFCNNFNLFEKSEMCQKYTYNKKQKQQTIEMNHKGYDEMYQDNHSFHTVCKLG